MSFRFSDFVKTFKLFVTYKSVTNNIPQLMLCKFKLVQVLCHKYPYLAYHMRANNRISCQEMTKCYQHIILLDPYEVQEATSFIMEIVYRLRFVRVLSIRAT